MDFKLRPMRLEDVPQLDEIEREAFPTIWPPTPFRKELLNSMVRYLVACSPRPIQQLEQGSPPQAGRPTAGFLAQRLLAGVRRLLGLRRDKEFAGKEFVAGYVGLWFMTDEAHITSIAVRESCRRLGLGEMLLVGAEELAMTLQSRCVTLEARVSNFPAHALYEKYGFQRVGVRKRYYADNNEDAVIMTADAIQSPEYRQLFQGRVDAFRQRRGEAVRILA